MTKAELIALADRLQGRADRLSKQNASCQLICDLLAPEMAKFDARTGHDIYTVRMAVDHASSIRTQAKEIADLTDAAACLRALAGGDDA